MVGGKTNSSRRGGRKSVKDGEKKTNVLSWERIGNYRVNNRGLKKKDRLGESVGKVSEWKWRTRLSREHL